MKKYGLVFKVLILVLILFSFTGLSLSCKKNQTQTSQSPTPSATSSKNDLTNVDPSSMLDKIKANVATAGQKAQGWQSGAVLYAASAKISSTLDPQDVIEVYTYGSPAAPEAWWTISISARSGNYIRAAIPKEDYLGNSLTAINAKYWKLSYVEAFQAAEKNGGKEWRDKQKDTYQITATLSNGEPNNYLYWVVDYQNPSGSDKLSVKIAAYNGDVVKEGSQGSSSI